VIDHSPISKHVLLISGEPQQGKSTLCDILRTRFDYRLCTVDDEYVEFVRTHYPALYFEQLVAYVAPHYNCILNTNSLFPGSDTRYTDHLFGIDVRAHWHRHLLAAVTSALESSDDVAAEGYLLKDCYVGIAHYLRTHRFAHVIEVFVERYSYYVTNAEMQRAGPFSVEQLHEMAQAGVNPLS
jgi:hypothetical protein